MKLLREIPQLLTLLNLLCGFSSLVLVARGDFLSGILILFAAFVFDLLDGLVARRFGWQSDLGVQLDSLADAVSFVIAPAFIMYWIFFDRSVLGLIVAFFSISFGIVRLARFNITLDAGYFSGMSVPYFTAIVIAVYFILFKEDVLSFSAWFVAIPLLFISSLQVSKVRFPSLKDPAFQKYKYAGMLIIVLFAGGIFAGYEPALLGILLQISALLFILLPFAFDKRVKRRGFVFAFIALFMFFSLWVDIMVGYAEIMVGMPLLFSVIFSPLIQLSLEK